MKTGFTLLELSIVLVIIGLIIGGITAGQELIRSAELSSVVADVNEYKIAINTFKLKYNDLPGDMDNATDYWGAAHATPATCITTVGTGTQTCDGDGDGLVWDGASTAYETHRFWQQLANAELISGNYTGVAGPDNSFDAVGGLNTPLSSISGAIFPVWSWKGFAGDANWFPWNHGLVIYLGDEAYAPTAGGVIKAEEAYGIDVKVDDGSPARGSVMTPKNNLLSNCATTDVVTTAAYDLSNDNLGCTMMFAAGN